MSTTPQKMVPGGPRLWAVDGQPEELQKLIYLAEDDDIPGATVVHEYRPTEAHDLASLAFAVRRRVGGLVQAVADWAADAHDLYTDDGGPEVDASALEDAITKAVLGGVDLTYAAWTPTGRSMTLAEARARLWPESAGGGQ